MFKPQSLVIEKQGGFGEHLLDVPDFLGEFCLESALTIESLSKLGGKSLPTDLQGRLEAVHSPAEPEIQIKLAGGTGKSANSLRIHRQSMTLQVVEHRVAEGDRAGPKGALIGVIRQPQIDIFERHESFIRARSPVHALMRIVQAARALSCCLKAVSGPFLPPLSEKPMSRTKPVKVSAISIVALFWRTASEQRCMRIKRAFGPKGSGCKSFLPCASRKKPAWTSIAILPCLRSYSRTLRDWRS